MVEENSNSKPTGPADGDPGKASGMFGPLTNLINQARSVHPAAGYLLIVLALFAVGVAIFEMAAPLSEDMGLLRAVLFIAGLLLFLLLLIAFVADFIVPSEKKSGDLQLRRAVLLLVIGLAGGFASWQVSVATPENCTLRTFLLGKAPEDCLGDPKKLAGKEADISPEAEKPPEPEPAPPEPEPEPPKAVILGGYVKNGKASGKKIAGLSVNVRFGLFSKPAPTSGQNLFSIELPRTAIDETVFVTIRAPGYRPLDDRKVVIKEPVKGIENTLNSWILQPKNQPPKPVVPGKQVLIPFNLERKLKTRAIQMQKKQ